MAHYPELDAYLARVSNGASPDAWGEVIAYLTDVWLDDYGRGSATNDIVETSSGDFWYLFDVGEQRLLAAYGVSRGRHAGARDASRMAGHPHSAGPLYHRGHAIAHTLGGPTDINLVPQLGSVNIGPFRRLEREAVATPGSFYFTYWSYGRGRTQMPSGVDQGLLIPGQPAKVTPHVN